MEKSKSQIEVEEAGPVCDRIIDRVSEVFVGNRLLLRKLLAAALANGHVLFEDYPGLGKTLLAKVFTKVIGSETKGCSSRRTCCQRTFWGRRCGARTRGLSN